MKSMLSVENMLSGLDHVLEFKRSQKQLHGWFLYQEIKMEERDRIAQTGADPDAPDRQAELLRRCIERMPLSIIPGAVIAGAQDDAFSPSYALINPAFEVETFAGYCDPVAVYDDIAPAPEEGITAERIQRVREYWANTDYVRDLCAVYDGTGFETKEVAYFVEPVTGHTIPDIRPILAHGIKGVMTENRDITPYSRVMKQALESAMVLARRYAELAEELADDCDDLEQKARYGTIARNCRKVPEHPAENLHEAVQSFALVWQVMALEQAPNPYAFSVGNLDRIMEPYFIAESSQQAVALLRHLLTFFMVGDRCWAISQNVMVGGRDSRGDDLTGKMTFVVLDAFFASNTPQPALSVKLHSKTPSSLYDSLGRFFFTPGMLTPSIFNDDSLFEIMRAKGIAEEHLPDYSIAGCQEPLIMGRESANTTNSWLNLAKVLECCLNDGKSLVSNEKMGLSWSESGFDGIEDVLADIRKAFSVQLEYFAGRMRDAANACTTTLSTRPVPFASALMGCLESGRDMRDLTEPGAMYNASGCLIHGLSVVTDSIHSVEQYCRHKPGKPAELLDALRADFKGFDSLRTFLANQDKYGNDIDHVDSIACELTSNVAELVHSLLNPAGRPFQADFSSPSTHLLYGYWVGATPDGRKAREMLGYGLDPRPGLAEHGMQGRILSLRKLPFEVMDGGYASHMGIDPSEYAHIEEDVARMRQMREWIIQPLFFSDRQGPYYVYFNVDRADRLKMVLADPQTHAPSGVYIMRIHGTFVNFLDLSPAIQNDIIERLSA